jgi:hypothetical protein
MCCVGEMVRKLRARLEVTSSNRRTRARVYFAWLVELWFATCGGLPGIFKYFFYPDVPLSQLTCDLRRARVGACRGFSNTFFTLAYPLVPVCYPGLKDPFCFSSLATRGSSRAELNCPDFYNFDSTLALSKLVRCDLRRVGASQGFSNTFFTLAYPLSHLTCDFATCACGDLPGIFKYFFYPGLPPSPGALPRTKRPLLFLIVSCARQ